LEVLVALVFTRISLLSPRPAAGKATKGMHLARFEGDIRATAEAPLTLEELLALLDSGGAKDAQSRENAIACYLAGGEGWRDALKMLGGTFAEGAAELRQRKED
jgi:hypothetical protein